MPEPSIHYKCSHCGQSQTYRLVADVAADPPAPVSPAEILSIDFRCVHCGSSATYELVPEGEAADTG
jgi:DNA-directed RNA polymerase subunit RPC12/RpoP